MRRVAECEAALHARVAVVRVAVSVGRHADDFAVPRLGVERTADAAVRARGRRHLRRGAELNQRLLCQRARRARLDARAARHTLGRENVSSWLAETSS